jgi:hypothetical protein
MGTNPVEVVALVFRWFSSHTTWFLQEILRYILQNCYIIWMVPAFGQSDYCIRGITAIQQA